MLSDWANTRSIPACAGEPGTADPALHQLRVYPRVCGGTALAGAERLNDQGLSPRVRGNPQSVGEEEYWTGSIPACAGEPLTTADPLIFVRVYPRVCGGTGNTEVSFDSERGLSPRVRGNLIFLFSLF